MMPPDAIILPQPRVQKLNLRFNALPLQADVLRLDELHPVISGNKWFKLEPYLKQAVQQNKKGIITWGGAWSNHIVATAAACKAANLQSVGIIRGDATAQWSATLKQAAEYGMQLHFSSRSLFKESALPDELRQLQNEYLLVPQGGYGELGAAGASTMLAGIKDTYSHIVCSVGTGTMLAGICRATPEETEVLGISSQKGNYSLEKAIASLLPSGRHYRYKVLHHLHHGSYARYTPELLQFMNDWFMATGIPTDFVYTAKVFYAYVHLSAENYFGAHHRILLVHSGGLQGNRGLPSGSLIYST